MEKARNSGESAAGYAENRGISYIREHLEESLSMLSEELDALGIKPVFVNDAELHSLDILLNVMARLIDSSWKLVYKHRSLIRRHEQLNDIYNKTSNDNVNLKKRVERSKEELEKKEHALQRGQESQRQLKAECESLSRDLKHEKDVTVKLRKQSRSKDNQHEHELRRVAQNGYKLCEHSEKSKGSHATKEMSSVEMRQSDCKDRLELYGQIILRLEQTNRLMLREISDLKQALCLRSSIVDARNKDLTS